MKRAPSASWGGPIIGTYGGALARLDTWLLQLLLARWLIATTDAERSDNEGWVREFVDRPLTRTVIEALLPH
jgi:hypothetical protein